jgi:predicted nucleic acid-binding protein
MGFLIDSSVIIAAERGKLNLEELLTLHAGQEAAFSAVTASELLHGLHRAQSEQQRAKRERFIEPLLSRFPVVPFGMETARIHARLSAELAAAGRTIGERDLMIAATAIQQSWTVLTRDQRSFPHVPGLAFQLV